MELHSQTSEPITKSAPSSRQARVGSTHEKPPSLRCNPSRFTGRLSTRKAQLALMAVDSCPLVIVNALPDGTIVVTAANGVWSSAKVPGRWRVENRSSVVPCSK